MANSQEHTSVPLSRAYDRRCDKFLRGETMKITVTGDSHMVRLYPHLARLAPGAGFQMGRNHAARGATVQSLDERGQMQQTVLDTSDIALLMIGSNDIERYDFTPQKHAQRISSLYRRLEHSAKTCYVIGLPTRSGLQPHAAVDSVATYRSRNTGCNNKLRSFLQGRYIKLPPGSYDEANYFGFNLVHFTDQHYETVARKVLTYIAEDMFYKSTPPMDVLAFRPDLWVRNPN